MSLQTAIPLELIEEMLKKKGSAMIRINGCSMAPLLADGSTASLFALDGQEVFPGEIVCFKAGPHLVTHRVVKSWDEGKNRFFLTRGDNAKAFDRPVAREAILGKVTAINGIPVTGYLWSFMNRFMSALLLLQARLAQARKSFAYRLLARAKRGLGIRVSFYPALLFMATLPFTATKYLLNRICLRASSSRKS